MIILTNPKTLGESYLNNKSTINEQITSKISNENPGLFLKHPSLKVLRNFIDHINHLESLEDIIWYSAQHAIKELGFEDCVVYLLDPDMETLIQVAAFGPKNPEKKKIANPITIRVGNGIVGRAAATKTAVRVADTRKVSDYIVDDCHRLSELAVPIIHQDKLLGVIDSENSALNFFNSEHQQYVEILASVISSKITFESTIIALEKTINALESSQKLSDVYFKISELTHNSKSEEEFYLNLHHLVSKQVKTQSFFVVLLDKNTGSYSFPYFHDEKEGGKFDIKIKDEIMRRSLAAEVIENQKPYLASRLELKQRSRKGQLVRNGEIAFSWLAVPFQISESLHGAIALQSYDETIIFSEADKEFLSFLSQHVSTAIERTLKDQKLLHQALHDPLTGLTNRSLFRDRVDHAFSRVRRHDSPELAVLFIDFDNFKLINDNFGHQTGDILLKLTAEKIQSQLRECDTLARLGGDEFAVLLEDLESTSFAITIAQRILKTMQKAITIGDQSIFVTISIGIALKDENTHLAEDLLKNADHAMYHAKNKGKNNIQVYETTLHRAVVYARQILSELEIALLHEQLDFHFQPIVTLDNKQVSGFEALIRWQHPTRGLIYPEEFIELAEQNDLVKEIDNQLLKRVAKILHHWQSMSTQPIYISVNISAKRFIDSRLVKEIGQLFKQYQLQPGSILVEVTEHALIKNIGKARLLFHQLKAIGVKISLDDFGTGYSSLSYLNQLPFDIIKIDRSFVTNINHRKLKHPIINTIVALAKTLDIELVAEGIESEFQLEVLHQMGCQYGQGYYLAKPMSEKDAEKFICNRNLEHL